MVNTWIKIGFRNLFKNKRRSCFTIGAIAIGFAAVNIFGGFTAYCFKGLEDSYIYAHGNGHLTVFKKGFLEKGVLDPFRYLLSEKEVAAVKKFCEADSDVRIVTPQLHISGLISNGKSSAIFVAVGRVPSDTQKIRSRAGGVTRKLKMFTGKELKDDFPFGVGLSYGLADKFNYQVGSDAILMAPTVDGQMNALDAEIVQLVSAPVEVLDNKLMVVPLEFARNLYDTSSADRINILLGGSAQTYAAQKRLTKLLSENGIDVEVKTWQELRPSYLKIRNMFTIIFMSVFFIVFLIVVLSVVNTISMAVLERTREIGTLRALGMKRRGVTVMFATESGLLGLMGSCLGMVLTVAVWWVIKVVQPTWFPPNIPQRAVLEVFLVPEYLGVSIVFLILLAMLTAVLPARRATGLRIIDALGHV